MKIISWNTNGLRATAKQGHFEPLFKKYKPDILCLQETKSEPEQLPNEIRNYFGHHSYFAYSKGRKGYSGVAVYTKEKPISVSGLGIPEFDDEGRTLALHFKNKKSEFILVNSYMPNGGSGPHRLEYKLKFYEAFLKFCNKYQKKGIPVIFTGDVNTAHTEIDLARPKANEENTGFLPIERAWIDKVIKSGYVDTFRYLNPNKKDAYTYWDQKTGARARNVGWRIDYFFVSKDIIKKVKNSSMITDYKGSDHCPIVLDVNI